MQQPAFHIRSYGHGHPPERHDFAQFVLPLQGSFEMEIAGRANRVSPMRAAFVEEGVSHCQEATGSNRSLIVDVDMAQLPACRIDRLRLRPFPLISRMSARLVEYMALARAGADEAAAFGAQPWLALLVEGLAGPAPTSPGAFDAMLAAVEARPQDGWTTRSMAQAAGMSVSRLYDRFRAAKDTTPHAFLEAARLRLAGDLLATGTLSLADVALAAGYGDQSALSRAMRRTLDTTPAAYRRAMRENAASS
ncbi:AraC family transcriptional regulator [Aureimonas altamirensis]|uniref:AraC family transcriptional regulator n=1 Tax=Aureimonas altamirensis TaxID=370622 RepID=UPI002036F683|nr:AraC family transcriptional regulator [Aureimonas altamirensis]MCM2505769.1 AraC family transcriptional regulator [Aureimonas altamirensis]